jgi:calcineurin-like phosphoesterase family protein
MSRVWVISDLHLGHKNILKFAGEYRNWADDIDQHDHTLIERIRSTCNSKRDILYILGDVCFDVSKMELLNVIPARKILVRGNHDNFQDGVYNKYFDSIQGIINYKGLWLSHAPVHPAELRGRRNVHGHVHHNSVRNQRHTDLLDSNYINACVENCNGFPINMAEIRDNTFKGMIK